MQMWTLQLLAQYSGDIMQITIILLLLLLSSKSTMTLAPIHCRPRVVPPLAKFPFPEYQTKHRPYPFVYCCVSHSSLLGMANPKAALDSKF